MKKTFSELNIGDSEYFQKTVTETDVYLFAGVSGDFNPIHINQISAEKTKFKKRIAHGMICASFISNVLGTKLPGEGTIYLNQSLNFKAPVYFGDTIKAVVTVKEKLEKGRVIMQTICYNQNDEVVIDGEALVIAPRELV